MLDEKAPHCGDVAEPGSGTDVLQGEIGLLEQSPRLVDPDAPHEICRRLVEVSAAPAAERARAHSGGISEPLHRQGLIEVLKDSQRLNKEFVLFGLSPAVQEVFRLTHVIRIFQVFQTEQEALGTA